jgi:hypothetical protein
MTTHRIYTEKVNGGVIAECRDESCAWDAKHSFMKFDKATRTSSPATCSVFPNRKVAVEAFASFHAKALVRA